VGGDGDTVGVGVGVTEDEIVTEGVGVTDGVEDVVGVGVVVGVTEDEIVIEGVGVTDGVEDVVGVVVGVNVGVGVTEDEIVTEGVGVNAGVEDVVGVGVVVGVLVGGGVKGYVSSSKNVINLYCAEVKLFLVIISPNEFTVLTSFGLRISLLRIKRLEHSI